MLQFEVCHSGYYNTYPYEYNNIDKNKIDEASLDKSLK